MGKENFDNFSNEQNETERNVEKFLEEVFRKENKKEVKLKIFYRSSKRVRIIRVTEKYFKFNRKDKVLQDVDNEEKIDLKSIEKIILPNGEKKNFYE